MAGKEDVVSVEQEVVVLVEEQQEVMAGKEVVVSVEQQEVATEQFGKSADGSDHSRTLADLKSKFGRFPSSPSSSKLQCPKVPKKLREDVEYRDYYAPKLISLGPYYHGESKLENGETLKLKLAEAYIQLCQSTVDEIYGTISHSINKLRGCYDAESTKKYKDDELTIMMLVDGCALLSYIVCVCLGGDHEDFDIRYQDLSLLHQDALLLENQLPYQLLQELMKMMGGSESANEAWTVLFQEFFGMIDESFFLEFFGIKEKEYSFLPKMKNYCCRLFLAIIQIINRKPKPKPDEESEPKPDEESKTKPDEESEPKPDEESKTKPDEESEPKPDEESKPKPDEESKPKPDKESRLCHHLLDLYRRNFLGDERSSATHSEAEIGKKGPGSVGDVKEQVMASFRNVKELMDAGIRIKRSPTRHLRDISFRSNGITACLRIPPITIDNSTKATFLNLIAYEMSSDVDHDFISYLRFLDSLIDHADDVKELQSAGVLQNNLGTHEEVALFFNTVSANLESNFHAYKDVRVRIWKHLKNHYNSKLKMWMTQFLDTYLGSPWTIIAWVGAALALFFTAVQTYFSVFPH
ncbi:putative UPF0481 protein At3g02645 [Vitis riparia]|uniref:putative UPF0481 protein At3g02645 n=1 Tax=Vitis riparia TaxID=96939 RepID=UPI00155B3F36|nr:putative UPF0481 protein At3g02645 [Vitis riparia]